MKGKFFNSFFNELKQNHRVCAENGKIIGQTMTYYMNSIIFSLKIHRMEVLLCK